MLRANNPPPRPWGMQNLKFGNSQLKGRALSVPRSVYQCTAADKEGFQKQVVVVKSEARIGEDVMCTNAQISASFKTGLVAKVFQSAKSDSEKALLSKIGLAEPRVISTPSGKIVTTYFTFPTGLAHSFLKTTINKGQAIVFDEGSPDSASLKFSSSEVSDIPTHTIVFENLPATLAPNEEGAKVAIRAYLSVVKEKLRERIPTEFNIISCKSNTTPLLNFENLPSEINSLSGMEVTFSLDTLEHLPSLPFDMEWEDIVMDSRNKGIKKRMRSTTVRTQNKTNTPVLTMSFFRRFIKPEAMLAEENPPAPPQDVTGPAPGGDGGGGNDPLYRPVPGEGESRESKRRKAEADLEREFDELIAWAKTVDAMELKVAQVEVAQRPTDPAKRAELMQGLKDLRARLSMTESASGGVLTALTGGSQTLTPKGAQAVNAHNPGGGTHDGGESGVTEGERDPGERDPGDLMEE